MLVTGNGRLSRWNFVGRSAPDDLREAHQHSSLHKGGDLARSRWLASSLLALSVLAGCARQEAPKYRTAEAQRGPIEVLVSATGTVEPMVQVEIGSQVSGTVHKLYADYNDRVKAGQILCQLEPSSFGARVAQSEASVARAEAALRESRRQYTRSKELVEKNYISAAESEAAEVAVEQSEADLKQARAQLQAARIDLDNSTIRTPIDGVVIARSVELGQTVAASLQAPKLFVVANNLTEMQVETRIDEADIGRIHAGLPARFTVDAFPEETFEGRVQQVRLEPIVEQGVVTYTTVIQTQNPELKLRPGMTANVSVLVARRDDVIKVPMAALRFRPAGEGAGMRGGMGQPGAGAGSGRGTAGAAVASRDPVGMPGSAARAGGGSGPRGGAVSDMPGQNGARRMKGGGADSVPRGRHMKGGADSPGRGPRTMAGGGAAPESSAAHAPAAKHGQIYVLRNGRPTPVPVQTGLNDGAQIEVMDGGIAPGDLVVVGLELPKGQQNLQPPPGMGGPQFGGGRRR